MSRRAKIAGTLGPACKNESTLAKMMKAGLDVVRLNFSHGDARTHRSAVRRMRRVATKANKHVPLLADLQGPRFRVGILPGGGIDLEAGTSVKVNAGKTRCEEGEIPVSYAALARDVRRGQLILIDDGKISLRAERVRGDAVLCTVERGGRLTDHKGINLPGSSLSVPTLTTKDKADLVTAVELRADWLAISFVRSAKDIRQARKLLKRAGETIPIMAKIERPEAIDYLDEILAEADGLLVARGDLGVELPTERVPILQKQIIDAANEAGKPVMTATQMLESMRDSPRPTRAEASDVANAVLDGSGCLLLTAETAAGSYPVEAVAMMSAIIEEAEASDRTRHIRPPGGSLSVSLTTCRAACRAAFDVQARYVAVFTQSGSTAQNTARFRPSRPILAFTPSTRVARRINMFWGVEPRKLPALKTIERLMQALDRVILEEKLAKKGEAVVVLSGSPIGVPGKTNLMKIHRVGSALRLPVGHGGK